ncbi:Protein wzxE [Escherichia coli]|uniref:Protein wzxE n=1 Tax=Escherichia coli TaxID=562 RepID=A0A377B8N8_ECOLX|nr:Protein wzxE [Escherichia coli]
MALITSVTLPVAYIMMRKLLAAQYSWDEVGIWQGVSSISDAYLQFITASFSVYLLPTLSRLTEKRDITREVVKSLKFVLPAVAAASFTVWLLRDFAIWLLLSNKFTAMRDLFAWQLVGDVLKVGRLCLWLSGDRQSVIAVLYSGGNQPVHFIDGICPLANPCAWCTGRGAGIYGNLYRLFFSLLWRVFTLA